MVNCKGTLMLCVMFITFVKKPMRAISDGLSRIMTDKICKS